MDNMSETEKLRDAIAEAMCVEDICTSDPDEVEAGGYDRMADAALAAIDAAGFAVVPKVTK